MRGCDKLINIILFVYNKFDVSFMYFVIKYMIKWIIYIVFLNFLFCLFDNILYYINMVL